MYLPNLPANILLEHACTSHKVSKAFIRETSPTSLVITQADQMFTLLDYVQNLPEEEKKKKKNQSYHYLPQIYREKNRRSFLKTLSLVGVKQILTCIDPTEECFSKRPVIPSQRSKNCWVHTGFTISILSAISIQGFPNSFCYPMTASRPAEHRREELMNGMPLGLWC